MEWVRDLNARCLEAIGKRLVPAAAARPDDGVSIDQADIDRRRRLDEAARHRAARCPYLLVEMRFDDAAWWEDAKRDAMKPTPNPTVLSSGTTAGLGRALANDAFTLARWTARADQRTAMLLFGLDPRVAMVISSLSPVEVRCITARSGNQLRPRWERNRCMWRDLLSAAISADDEALTDIHYGIQLLGGDLLSMGKAP